MFRSSLHAMCPDIRLDELIWKTVNWLVLAGVPHVRTVPPEGRRRGTAVRLGPGWSWKQQQQQQTVTIVIIDFFFLGRDRLPPPAGWDSPTSARGVGLYGRPSQGGAHRGRIPRLGGRRFCSGSGGKKLNDNNYDTDILECIDLPEFKR